MTPDQIQAAVNALGFTVHVQVDGAIDCTSASVWQARQTTLLLATLEALVVHCQLDQDWHDPVDEQRRHIIARAAQAQFDAGGLDALAAGLRRVQTLTSLLDGLDDEELARTPGACPPRRPTR